MFRCFSKRGEKGGVESGVDVPSGRKFQGKNGVGDFSDDGKGSFPFGFEFD